ncbi:MAG: exo-alpha-sialidase [Porphyromonadaceae bacterium]|nr:exo-alpha-sialidase [Porphyromonadaceae bacterium]
MRAFLVHHKIIFTINFIMISFAFYGCGKTPLEKLKIEVISAGFIYEEASFPECHASTIVETPTGFLSAWFGGTREGYKDVCIYISIKEKGGEWSVPVKVADGIINDSLQYPCWNPVLFKRDNGDLILYYKIGPNPREWWGMYKISADEGKTWSKPVKIPDNMLGPIKNNPARLLDGTILYPTSVETKEMWNIYVETSDQDLKKWEKIWIDNNNFNAIQPTILFHKNNRIQMLCRSKEKRILETWSDNMGKTWTPVEPTSLPNNNSGIDGVTCSNGLHLLAYNPITKGRNKLSLAGSYDGKIWRELVVLENQPEGEFSYPAIIQGKDGTIHITYTYNRNTIKYVHLKIK